MTNTQARTPAFAVGDRIELESMPDDPAGVPIGTKGKVTFCEWVDMGPQNRFWQVGVDWDNGRTLMLTVPPDRARKIG